MKIVKKIVVTKEEEKVIKNIVDFLRFDDIDRDEIFYLLYAIVDGDDQWNDYEIEIEEA